MSYPIELVGFTHGDSDHARLPSICDYLAQSGAAA
jgi:hypothetical protein